MPRRYPWTGLLATGRVASPTGMAIKASGFTPASRFANSQRPLCGAGAIPGFWESRHAFQDVAAISAALVRRTQGASRYSTAQAQYSARAGQPLACSLNLSGRSLNGLFNNGEQSLGCYENFTWRECGFWAGRPADGLGLAHAPASEISTGERAGHVGRADTEPCHGPGGLSVLTWPRIFES
jgi:hypothetical protein